MRSCLQRVTFASLLVLLLVGCTEHKVDSFLKWCEHVSGVNLEKKYGGVVTPFFSVSFHFESIRDDLVNLLI